MTAQPGLAVEQLLLAVAERYTGHAQLRRELRLERAGGQRQRLKALAGHANRSQGHGLALP